jgi:hypothetical protein
MHQTVILTSHDGVDKSTKNEEKKENAAYGRFFL